MDDFVNVVKREPKVRDKINDNIDKHNKLPYKYQSKIGNDTLIQNVILKELIKKMGSTITDLDIELKIRISRIRYLESENS